MDVSGEEQARMMVIVLCFGSILKLKINGMGASMMRAIGNVKGFG